MSTSCGPLIEFSRKSSTESSRFPLYCVTSAGASFGVTVSSPPSRVSGPHSREGEHQAVTTASMSRAAGPHRHATSRQRPLIHGSRPDPDRAPADRRICGTFTADNRAVEGYLPSICRNGGDGVETFGTRVIRSIAAARAFTRCGSNDPRATVPFRPVVPPVPRYAGRRRGAHLLARLDRARRLDRAHHAALGVRLQAEPGDLRGR